jgi:histidine decarboxylase
MFSIKNTIKESVSPYEYYCDGFKSPGGSGKGYIGAIVLSVGKSPRQFSHEGSSTLDGIIAYDNAEAESAYIGQINMTIVSSFLGPQGIIFGYDIAKTEYKNDLIGYAGENKVPVYGTKSFEDAGVSLLGTRDEKHFPFIPGSHVPCAGRYITEEGPAHIYCAIAVGIPDDRETSAVLLMEDTGKLTNDDKDKQKEKIKRDIAESVLKVGETQGIKYKEIFVGLKDVEVGENEFGCALVAMPYFSLAKKAILEEVNIESSTLRDWEKACQKYFLYKNI